MDLIRKFLCKFGKHKFGPYEPGQIRYENLPGKSQPVRAFVQVRECVCCNYVEPGPNNGVWQ